MMSNVSNFSSCAMDENKHELRQSRPIISSSAKQQTRIEQQQTIPVRPLLMPLSSSIPERGIKTNSILIPMNNNSRQTYILFMFFGA